MILGLIHMKRSVIGWIILGKCVWTSMTMEFCTYYYFRWLLQNDNRTLKPLKMCYSTKMVRKSFGGKCIIRSGIFKRSKASNLFSNSVLTKLKVCVSLYIITWLSNVHWQHLWFLWQYKWTLRLQWIFCGFRDPQTHVAIMS